MENMQNAVCGLPVYTTAKSLPYQLLSFFPLFFPLGRIGCASAVVITRRSVHKLLSSGFPIGKCMLVYIYFIAGTS